MISIIIPFRDNVELLRQCVRSVLNMSIYRDFEVLLVDNRSVERETQDYLAEVGKLENVRVLRYPHPFNFSALNNFAAREAKGEFLLFLNNDTKVISPDWMERMLECFEESTLLEKPPRRPNGTPPQEGNGCEIGVVGAKLLYPNKTIQHAGVEIRNGEAVHAFGKQPDSSDPNEGFNQQRDCIAVTAACMMTRKSLFKELGGFDEVNLSIAYNDVDYCLKVREKGLRVVYTPDAVLYHYESVTRGRDILKRFFHRKRYAEFLRERAFLKNKWPRYFGS